MANSNGKIYDAVSIADVQQVIGDSSGDLATLCTSEKINPNSFCKPVRHPKMFASLTEADWQQGQQASEGYLEAMTCGLLIGNAHDSLFGGAQRVVDKVVDISKDTKGFLYNLAKGTTGNWVYQRPQGLEAGSPYRLDDFRGYNHYAVNPMPSVKPPIDNMYGYESGIFNATIDLPELTLDQQATSITLEKLKLPSGMLGVTLRQMYFGILLYNDDLTDVMWATESQAQKDKGNNQVTFEDNDYVTISNRTGKYKARAFFSTQPLVANQSTTDGLAFFLPSMDTPIEVAVLDKNTPLVTLKAINKQISGSYYPQIEVTNNMPFAVTVTDVLFNTGFNLGLDSSTPVPRTIEALGTATFRASVGASFQQSFIVAVTVDGKTFTASV